MVDSRGPSQLPAQSDALSRRRLLRGLIGAAAAGVAASLIAVLKLAVPQKTGGYTPGVEAADILAYAEGGKIGQGIRLDELEVGDSVLAYPQGKESNFANIIRVVREDPARFQPPTRLEWTDQGVVAYSGICTHLACTVSWEKAPRVEASVLICHCHNGLYDPLRGGMVIGGPPPKPLAQIAVKVGPDGVLRAGGGFAGPVGPAV